MPRATIISYRGDGDRPRAEVALPTGERVQLVLDSEGLSIVQSDGGAVFRGDSALVARLCAGLVQAGAAPAATPLQVMLGAVVQLPSVQAVKEAFEAAAEGASP